MGHAARDGNLEYHKRRLSMAHGRQMVKQEELLHVPAYDT